MPTGNLHQSGLINLGKPYSAQALGAILSTSNGNKAPLADIRVLDFGRVVAGAGATGILAKYGAEVIKVEWPEYPGLENLRLDRGADGINGLNRGALFNTLNVDKLSVTLNMKHPTARDLVKRLLALCDIVLENFRPPVMRSFGIDYESAREIRPDVIYISQSGWGKDGPRALLRSYGQMALAHSGLAHLCGLPDRPPAGWHTSYCDHVAAWFGAMAAMMGLHYRRRTGRGVFVDLAQTQSASSLLGVSFLDYSVNGRKTRRPGFPPGNRRLHPLAAPHNVFPCSGQDTWVTIAVFADDEWKALKKAMGSPDWAADQRFDTAEGRSQNQDELEREIACWTKGFERYNLAFLLQSHGVRAGIVQTARDRVEWDSQLEHRGTFQIINHPEVGPRRYETVAAHLSKSPYKPKRAAPLMGQDNLYVLKDLLGLSETEIAELKSQDVIRIANTNEGK